MNSAVSTSLAALSSNEETRALKIVCEAFGRSKNTEKLMNCKERKKYIVEFTFIEHGIKNTFSMKYTNSISAHDRLPRG